MNKTKWIYIIILVILFVLLIFIESSRKKPLDWSYSFSSRDKIPFGTYVLKDLIKSTFKEKQFVENSDGIYMFTRIHGFTENTCFIYITKSFTSDKYDYEKMIKLIEAGNDVFISAESFDKNFLDSLGIKTNFKFSLELDSEKVDNIYLVNPGGSNGFTYKAREAFTQCYFKSFDTLNTTIIGTDNRYNPNFIKIKKGGNLYLSTVPLLYTNYNILYGDYKYPFTTLSYLNGNTIIWDEYYKPNKPMVSTPLRYILSQPALKAGYFLLMICIVIYLIFEGKRKQRIIPVINPPQNMSLEFAVTLGRLYFNSGNNKDIALKKFSYFCDYIRNKFNIKTISYDIKFYELLAEKTGVSIDTITGIFKNAEFISNQRWTGNDDLMAFNKKIEEFYDKTK